MNLLAVFLTMTWLATFEAHLFTATLLRHVVHLPALVALDLSLAFLSRLAVALETLLHALLHALGSLVVSFRTYASTFAICNASAIFRKVTGLST